MNKGLLQLKKINEKDIPIIINLMQDFYLKDGYYFNLEKTRENISASISDHAFVSIYKILYQDKIIGYIIMTFGYSFEFGGKTSCIDEFYIDESCRGKGFGTEVLDSIEKEMTEKNIFVITLEVEHNNEAKKLYIRSGYKTTGRDLMMKHISK